MHTPRNEAAFPRPYSEQQPGDRMEFMYAQSGMTMREYFAAMAMQGLLANWESMRVDPEKLAGIAFSCADAMLSQAAK